MRFDEALEIFFELLNEMPSEHKAQLKNAIAVAYLDMENYEEAMNFINQSIEINPNYAEAYINKAEILFEQDKMNEGCIEVENAKRIGLDLNNPDILDAIEKCKD